MPEETMGDGETIVDVSSILVVGSTVAVAEDAEEAGAAAAASGRFRLVAGGSSEVADVEDSVRACCACATAFLARSRMVRTALSKATATTPSLSVTSSKYVSLGDQTPYSGSFGYVLFHSSC